MKKISIIACLSIICCILFSGCGENNKKLTLNSDEVKLTVGDDYQLTLNTKDTKITWSSSDEKVASVSGGKVIGVGKGNALVTAMNEDGEKAVCKVSVDSTAVDEVRLNKHNIELKKNESEEIGSSVTPQDASTNGLVWESSNDNVARVDNRGTVTGIKKGKAVITCSSPNGKSDTCEVVVKSNKKKKLVQTNNNQANSGNSEYDNKLLKDTPLYCRASDFATLRASASRSGREVDIVLTGESVVYLSSTTEFYHVIYQGEKGYVLKDYFSTDPDAPLNYGDR